MISGIRIKICGITTLVDAEAADAIGADFLGFILHAKSPRHIPLDQFKAMAPRLPPRRKVAVAVSVVPTSDDLLAWIDAGFDAFQVHFPLETTMDLVAAWSAAVGRERLWLAPKLPPGVPVPQHLLALADTFLWDTYAANSYGGTGKTGDWDGFRAAKTAHPDKTWILAGGLGPQNVADALRATGATFIDSNSGVELAPGIKDPAKLKALAASLRLASATMGTSGI